MRLGNERLLRDAERLGRRETGQVDVDGACHAARPFLTQSFHPVPVPGLLLRLAAVAAHSEPAHVA